MREERTSLPHFFMKETHLVGQVIDFLNYRGHFVHRTQSGMTRVTNKYGQQHMMRLAQAGTADITGCSKDGRFVAVECKIRPNKPTELQERYLAEIRKRGGIALVAYDLNDVAQHPDLV
jgi:hypothetical protein